MLKLNWVKTILKKYMEQNGMNRKELIAFLDINSWTFSILYDKWLASSKTTRKVEAMLWMRFDEEKIWKYKIDPITQNDLSAIIVEKQLEKYRVMNRLTVKELYTKLWMSKMSYYNISLTKKISHKQIEKIRKLIPNLTTNPKDLWKV